MAVSKRKLIKKSLNYNSFLQQKYKTGTLLNKHMNNSKFIINPNLQQHRTLTSGLTQQHRFFVNNCLNDCAIAAAQLQLDVKQSNMSSITPQTNTEKLRSPRERNSSLLAVQLNCFKPESRSFEELLSTYDLAPSTLLREKKNKERGRVMQATKLTPMQRRRAALALQHNWLSSYSTATLFKISSSQQRIIVRNRYANSGNLQLNFMAAQSVHALRRTNDLLHLAYMTARAARYIGEAVGGLSWTRLNIQFGSPSFITIMVNSTFKKVASFNLKMRRDVSAAATHHYWQAKLLPDVFNVFASFDLLTRLIYVETTTPFAQLRNTFQLAAYSRSSRRLKALQVPAKFLINNPIAYTSDKKLLACRISKFQNTQNREVARDSATLNFKKRLPFNCFKFLYCNAEELQVVLRALVLRSYRRYLVTISHTSWRSHHFLIWQKMQARCTNITPYTKLNDVLLSLLWATTMPRYLIDCATDYRLLHVFLKTSEFAYNFRLSIKDYVTPSWLYTRCKPLSQQYWYQLKTRTLTWYNHHHQILRTRYQNWKCACYSTFVDIFKDFKVTHPRITFPKAQVLSYFKEIKAQLLSNLITKLFNVTRSIIFKTPHAAFAITRSIAAVDFLCNWRQLIMPAVFTIPLFNLVYRLYYTFLLIHPTLSQYGVPRLTLCVFAVLLGKVPAIRLALRSIYLLTRRLLTSRNIYANVKKALWWFSTKITACTRKITLLIAKTSDSILLALRLIPLAEYVIIQTPKMLKFVITKPIASVIHTKYLELETLLYSKPLLAQVLNKLLTYWFEVRDKPLVLLAETTYAATVRIILCSSLIRFFFDKASNFGRFVLTSVMATTYSTICSVVAQATTLARNWLINKPWGKAVLNSILFVAQLTPEQFETYIENVLLFRANISTRLAQILDKVFFHVAAAIHSTFFKKCAYVFLNWIQRVLHIPIMRIFYIRLVRSTACLKRLPIAIFIYDRPVVGKYASVVSALTDTTVANFAVCINQWRQLSLNMIVHLFSLNNDSFVWKITVESVVIRIQLIFQLYWNNIPTRLTTSIYIFRYIAIITGVLLTLKSVKTAIVNAPSSLFKRVTSLITIAANVITYNGRLILVILQQYPSLYLTGSQFAYWVLQRVNAPLSQLRNEITVHSASLYLPNFWRTIHRCKASPIFLCAVVSVYRYFNFLVPSYTAPSYITADTKKLQNQLNVVDLKKQLSKKNLLRIYNQQIVLISALAIQQVITKQFLFATPQCALFNHAAESNPWFVQSQLRVMVEVLGKRNIKPVAKLLSVNHQLVSVTLQSLTMVQLALNLNPLTTVASQTASVSLKPFQRSRYAYKRNAVKQRGFAVSFFNLLSFTVNNRQRISKNVRKLLRYTKVLNRYTISEKKIAINKLWNPPAVFMDGALRASADAFIQETPATAYTPEANYAALFAKTLRIRSNQKRDNKNASKLFHYSKPTAIVRYTPNLRWHSSLHAMFTSIFFLAGGIRVTKFVRAGAIKTRSINERGPIEQNISRRLVSLLTFLETSGAKIYSLSDALIQRAVDSSLLADRVVATKRKYDNEVRHRLTARQRTFAVATLAYYSALLYRPIFNSKSFNNVFWYLIVTQPARNNLKLLFAVLFLLRSALLRSNSSIITSSKLNDEITFQRLLSIWPLFVNTGAGCYTLAGIRHKHKIAALLDGSSRLSFPARARIMHKLRLNNNDITLLMNKLEIANKDAATQLAHLQLIQIIIGCYAMRLLSSQFAIAYLTMAYLLLFFSIVTLFFERKMIAIAQKRLGISFLGRNGWVHLPADMVKFWFKYSARHEGSWLTGSNSALLLLIGFFCWNTLCCFFFFSRRRRRFIWFLRLSVLNIFRLRKYYCRLHV